MRIVQRRGELSVPCRFLLLLYMVFTPEVFIFGQDTITNEIVVNAEFYDQNESCFRCHGSSKYTYFNPVTNMNVSDMMCDNRLVQRDQFYTANHKGFACTDCHSAEYDSFPHPGNLRMESMYACTDCHGNDKNYVRFNFEEIEKEFQQSVHYSANSEEFTCWECHNPHSYKINIRDSENISRSIAYDNQICLECHSDFERFQLLTDRKEINLIGKHEWLPNQALHFSQVRCIECHARLNDSLMVAHRIMPKEKAVKRCVECHSQNSLLMSSLYKFHAKENRTRAGFLNAIILNDVFVIGANRNILLNKISLVVIISMICFILIHYILFRIAKKEKRDMSERIYHYPLWIRLWHMANALFCLALIISGISMQFSEPGRHLIRFDIAVTIHNSSALLLVINYLFFIIANKLTGNSKHYIISRKNYADKLFDQFRYYISGIFKGEKAPFPVNHERKFNPLQHFAYIVVMYALFPVILITGCGLFFPGFVIPRIFGISGLFLTDLIHILVGFIISMFLIVHIYFCMLGTNIFTSFRSMINGWVEVH